MAKYMEMTREDINAAFILYDMSRNSGRVEPDVPGHHSSTKGSKRHVISKLQNVVNQVPLLPLSLNNNDQNEDERTLMTLPPPLVHDNDDERRLAIRPFRLLRHIIGVRSDPFEKQLTASDVKDSQARLALHKEFVETCLIPMFNAYENLQEGIEVTTYDVDGREFKMKFKIWASKLYVLIEGWKRFCKHHNLMQIRDRVTVWMFRHLQTEKLCFVITHRREEIQ